MGAAQEQRRLGQDPRSSRATRCSGCAPRSGTIRRRYPPATPSTTFLLERREVLTDELHRLRGLMGGGDGAGASVEAFLDGCASLERRYQTDVASRRLERGRTRGGRSMIKSIVCALDGSGQFRAGAEARHRDGEALRCAARPVPRAHAQPRSNGDQAVLRDRGAHRGDRRRASRVCRTWTAASRWGIPFDAKGIPVVDLLVDLGRAHPRVRARRWPRRTAWQGRGHRDR